MAAVDVVSGQNIVARVTNLPLVSSTYDMVSHVYCNTKDSHPYIKSVCEVAEMGVKTISSVALTSAMPIIDKLEPQIAIANDLACKGLDKIEKTLPILHQPSEQIVASAKDAVTGAKEAVTTTVNGARDTVSYTLIGVVDKTKGAVQDSVEMTRSVVNGSVNTVMGSRMVQLVSTGMDTALSTSETLVDQYLPLTKEELEVEAKAVKGFDTAADKPSYYVRLGSLSSKLRKRAYQQAVAKVRDTKQISQDSISKLNNTVDLIEFARRNMDDAHQKIHEKLNSWVEWTKNGHSDGDTHEAEHIESRTLAIARSLTHQLQTTCLTLVSSLQGLPQNIQDQALSVTHSASEVYGNFSKASAFRDLSDTVLTSSKAQLGKMKDSLDVVMDYLVNNTPLNWLVGPFYPQLNSPQAKKQEKISPPEVEMEPVNSNQ
ncbi:perilipin-2 isoform X1 [Megalops cyprinoides]|uniref:perilipin-2 isoform X1 n=1 Tax=Megalops cyprinoides TaxID=118141 RepID=UPI0018651843|nr:perilipin-2 isoform X1 [Megalops cyprinoides]